MSLGVLAFIAGVLSVLAPCVLPVLPVMLGGGLSARAWYRPLIIGLSTALCITLFTVLLKVSTAFINVPEEFWLGFSATIIIVYGLTLLFPQLWETLSLRLGLNRANSLAARAKKHEGVRGDILLGASFGPIFASCSPTYFILLSLVFPQSITQGILYTLLYSFGFVLFLLVIIYTGRAVISRIRWAVDPRGRFKKALGVLLIVVGILIATGLMKKIEIALLDSGFLDITTIEQKLIDKVEFDKMKDGETNKACFTPSSGEYSCNDAAQQSTGTAQSYDSKDPRAKLLNENYTAPELGGLENWLNTTGWSSLRELRGKVVIIDFWTYSCINCIRTLPYLEKLHKTYADDGLVLIGIHAPEFQFERDIKNVKSAVAKFGLTYPVVQDNNFTTWRNYDNLYWPAKYIIDREGNVRYTHFGEGAYEETEQVVQYLLGLNNEGVLEDVKNAYTLQQTHETYLGTARRDNYSAAPSDKLHYWWTQGTWQADGEKITMKNGTGSISINAYAREANLVLGTEGGTVAAEIYRDGKKVKDIVIDGYQLYNLMDNENAGKHTIEIKFLSPGVMAYAYTFG